MCAWTGVIRGYPKLVVVCIGGRGRVKLWAAGPFGHIVCFRVQAAEGWLLFQGRLPSSTLPVSPVDFYLTAALGTEWTEHTHTHTHRVTAGRMDAVIDGWIYAELLIVLSVSVDVERGVLYVYYSPILRR